MPVSPHTLLRHPADLIRPVPEAPPSPCRLLCRPDLVNGPMPELHHPARSIATLID